MAIAWKLFWEINKPTKAVDGAIDGFCPPDMVNLDGIFGRLEKIV